jgi:hypothetical protein
VPSGVEVLALFRAGDPILKKALRKLLFAGQLAGFDVFSAEKESTF